MKKTIAIIQYSFRPTPTHAPRKQLSQLKILENKKLGICISSNNLLMYFFIYFFFKLILLERKFSRQCIFNILAMLLKVI
jgi:hypothetical protein